MDSIILSLPAEDVSPLANFAREHGAVSVLDLIAVIVRHSDDLKALRKADRVAGRLMNGLLSGGL
ncbi:hypothetical protein [Nocardioides deserti]|uniref:CopG family transcriptional regulator n=1 Tax=Nocardioides deserti TaxID=1588644 RepID=A0ABR6UA51_9ACTN|nr:hypothetical protein [Nocardioides deserti]MBC2961320.1 hypothetical protein [Nocardioides deserti]GGO72396.1 hypothetical protein GCM10012276_15660 [Nocardioides deserti]